MFRAMADAVMTGRAGHRRATDHIVGHGKDQFHFLRVQGFGFLIGRQIVLYLLQTGHAGQGDSHRQALQETEGPRGNLFLRPGRLQPRLILWLELG